VFQNNIVSREIVLLSHKVHDLILSYNCIQEVNNEQRRVSIQCVEYVCCLTQPITTMEKGEQQVTTMFVIL